MCSNIWLIHFIHSFWRLFKTLLLRGAPSPVTAKEEGLEGDVKFGREGHQQGSSQPDTVPFVLRLEVSSWFLGPALRLNSVELSLFLAPPLGINFLLHCACCLGTMCLLFASYLRHFSLAVAGLIAPLSRFFEGALYRYPECMTE